MCQPQRQRKPYTHHGHSGTRAYKTWLAMIDRCTKPEHPAFHRYGGRGITVCPEWTASFLDFLEHVGQPPTPRHELDRRDNNRGYEPGNVRWVTPKENALNRSTNHIVTVGGIAKTIREWSDETGLKFTTISMRLRRGWTPEAAIKRATVNRGGSHL